MPGSRRRVLGHVAAELRARMGRTKTLGADIMETPLNRCLSTLDITLLGIGHMVGAGIYVLAGPVARDVAGPGVVLSFLLAGVTSLLAALCYAEFGARVPKAGSAYVYAYVTVGEFWAFVIGWNIILEHMIGAASVARAWSGALDALAGGAVSNWSAGALGGVPGASNGGAPPDLLAAAITLLCALALAGGAKMSAAVNAAFTVVNVLVIVLVVSVGFACARAENWAGSAGFLPFGFSGVLAGAATAFYAFVGFDSIATAGEEARNPAVSIPAATLVAMVVVTALYTLVSAALTLMQPYWALSATAALPEAVAAQGLGWASWAVSLGALAGMTTTLLGSLFALPRTVYAMATDGLLFSWLARVNAKTQVPLVTLSLSALCSAVLAMVVELQVLVEFMSIGTLLAYTVVSAAVVVLRYRPAPPAPARPAPPSAAAAAFAAASATDDSSQSGLDLSSPQSERKIARSADDSGMSDGRRGPRATLNRSMCNDSNAISGRKVVIRKQRPAGDVRAPPDAARRPLPCAAGATGTGAQHLLQRGAHDAPARAHLGALRRLDGHRAAGVLPVRHPTQPRGRRRRRLRHAADEPRGGQGRVGLHAAAARRRPRRARQGAPGREVARRPGGGSDAVAAARPGALLLRSANAEEWPAARSTGVARGLQGRGKHVRAWKGRHDDVLGASCHVAPCRTASGRCVLASHRPRPSLACFTLSPTAVR